MRVLDGEPYVHTLDLKDDDLYRRGEPLRRANVDLGRCPYLALCAADARSRRAGDNSHLPPGGAAVLGEADFPHAEFRGPGSHRDGEHAHHYRDARRSSSRLQPPRCCRSSIPHPVTSNRSSMHCSKKRRGWAERPSVCLRFMRAGAFAPWRCGHVGGVCRIPTPQPARLRAGNITSAPSGRRTHRPYRRSKGTGPL